MKESDKRDHVALLYNGNSWYCIKGTKGKLCAVGVMYVTEEVMYFLKVVWPKALLSRDGKIIDESRKYMTEHHPKRAEFENLLNEVV